MQPAHKSRAHEVDLAMQLTTLSRNHALLELKASQRLRRGRIHGTRAAHELDPPVKLPTPLRQRSLLLVFLNEVFSEIRNRLHEQTVSAECEERTCSSMIRNR
jgi:hypothetical protein